MKCFVFMGPCLLSDGAQSAQWLLPTYKINIKTFSVNKCGTAIMAINLNL